MIRFGLGAIKGVGEKAVVAIADQRREGGDYVDLFDFCERVDLSAVNRAAIEALICAGGFDRTGGMRKALCDAVDAAISCGQDAQRDARTGQMGLFGGGDDDSIEAPRNKLAAAEWPEAEMLAREKAVLGLYITRHPLAADEDLLNACATATTVDLAKYEDGQKVIIGGMVSTLRTLVAKGGRQPGKRLGIVTLEDLKGRVEGIVFPRQLDEYRSLLVPDRIVFLEAEVDRKREQPSLRVSRVIPREDAVAEFATALLLDVDQGTPIDQLIRLLRDHRGSCPVYVSVYTSDGMVAQIECNPAIKVRCASDCLDALTKLLGDRAVRVLGAGRRQIKTTKPPAASITAA